MPITARAIRDAVIHHPASRLGSYPFECLWTFISPRGPPVTFGQSFRGDHHIFTVKNLQKLRRGGGPGMV